MGIHPVTDLTGVSCDQVEEREKTWTWFTNNSVYWYNPKVNSWCIILPIKCGFEKQWRKGNLPVGRTLGSSVQFSRSVMSGSLWLHELQLARPPCPSRAPWVYPNSCSLSRWCHLTISSSVIPLSSCPQSFPASVSFSSESALHIRWPKYWSFSFSISPSNEHPGLISFRMDWLDLLSVQRTLKSLLQHHSSKTSILQCSAFFIVQILLVIV